MNQQDYCNLIERYINTIFYSTWSRKFTKNELCEYLIKKADVFEDSNEEKIYELGEEVLETLIRVGKISHYTKYFKVEAPITPNDDIRIFQQPPRITKVNQSLIDTINEIDRNTQYLGDNL